MRRRATILDVSSKNPDTIYHYTDFAGLSGILEHRNLWATDMKYLNDAREIDFALKDVVEMFHEVAGELPAPTDEERELCIPDGVDPDFSDPYALNIPTKVAISGAIDIVEQMARPDDQSLPEGWRWGNGYVTCFTSRGDSLGQWRGYAGGDGFAIGFKRKALSNIAVPAWDFKNGMVIDPGDQTKWFLAPSSPAIPVRYGTKAIHELIAGMREALLRDALDRGGVMNIVDAATVYSNALLRCSASIKAKAFKSEKEWRIISLYTGTSPVIKFRRGIKAAGGVTPYIELPFSDDAVVEIVIGPGTASDLRERAIWQLVSSVGYDTSKVKVRHSKIAYRE